jgi:hypothetical protein
MRRRLRLTPELRSSLALALAATFATRLVVWIAGIVGFERLAVKRDFATDVGGRMLAMPFRSDAVNSLIASASHWDAAMYLQIATHGYSGSRSIWAYFPAYPLVLKAAAVVVPDPHFAGIAVSTAAMIVALVLLHRLALLDLGAEGARCAVIALAIFPTSYYLSAIYTESMFIAATLGAIYAARTARWAPAGALGALASATRPNGVLIAVPLLMIYLQGRDAPRWGVRNWFARRRVRLSIMWLALVPAGLGAYMLYLALGGHSPMLWATSQSAGGRWTALGVLSSVSAAVRGAPHELQQLVTGGGQPDYLISFPGVNLLDLAALIFAIGGLWLARRLVPPAYVVYGAAQLIAVSGFTHVLPLLSVSRHVLIVFPAFLGWGAWLAERPRSRRAALPIFAVLLVVLTAAWATGSWIA